MLAYQRCNFVSERAVAEEEGAPAGDRAVAENNSDVFEEQRYAVFE